MTSTALKKELHQAIEDMPDAVFLKAVYAMFKGYTVSYDSNYELSDQEKDELDTQKKLHKAGKSRSFSVAEVKKMAFAKLKR